MPINASADAEHAPAEADLCSIVLPTYNRAGFLPEAIATIRAQSHQHFELIIVDDGSTDDTRQRVARLTRELRQPTRYVHQPNRGVALARNRGIELARGQFTAFFDSDDLWLPHHLGNCIAALKQTPDVTFAYGASRSIEMETGRVLRPHNFYVEGRPRPFLALRTRRVGDLHILDDPRACLCAIRSGLHASLPVSVFRRSIFDSGIRFPDVRMGSDRYFVIQALKRGAQPAYFNNVHQIRRVHAGNLTTAGRVRSPEQRARVARAVIGGYELLVSEKRFTATERRALRRRIAHDRFWLLGYDLFGQPGHRDEAIDEYRKALRLWPWDPFMWKTFLLHCVRRGLATDRGKRLTL